MVLMGKGLLVLGGCWGGVVGGVGFFGGGNDRVVRGGWFGGLLVK